MIISSKKHLTLLMFFILLIPVIPYSVAISPSDIVIDGDLSDWDSDDSLGSRNGAEFGFTWDADNLFFYWNGTDLSSVDEGADLFLQASLRLIFLVLFL